MAQGMRQPTAEEIAAFHAIDKECRLAWFPPQLDEEGKIRACAQCHGSLHPLHNREYDASVGGYCNKLCRRVTEKRLMNEDGMLPSEASMEVDKLEGYKPKKVVAEV